MKQVILTLCMAFIGVFTMNAQDESSPVEFSKEYEEAVYEMFDLNGSNETYKAVVVQMTDMFQQQFPQVPEEYWNRFKEEVLKDGIIELKKDIVPIYAKYLTLEEIKAINTFYASPAGKKLALSTPMITQESMLVGQAWGAKIAEKVMTELQEEGY
jgi:hypothetical protein